MTSDKKAEEPPKTSDKEEQPKTSDKETPKQGRGLKGPRSVDTA